MAQLKTCGRPESEGKIKNWNQVDTSFPDVPLASFGAGTDSGTFDYFTEAINGEEGASRTDYSPSEDDNVTIQGVKGDKGAVGYFGLSYVEQNPDAVKAVEVDGDGCDTHRGDRAGQDLQAVGSAAVHLRRTRPTRTVRRSVPMSTSTSRTRRRSLSRRSSSGLLPSRSRPRRTSSDPSQADSHGQPDRDPT